MFLPAGGSRALKWLACKLKYFSKLTVEKCVKFRKFSIMIKDVVSIKNTVVLMTTRFGRDETVEKSSFTVLLYNLPQSGKN